MVGCEPEFVSLDGEVCDNTMSSTGRPLFVDVVGVVVVGNV